MGSRSYFCYRDDICYNNITLFGHIRRFSRNRMPLSQSYAKSFEKYQKT